MRFTGHARDLTHAVDTAARAIDTKAAARIPILGAALLRADAAGLAITATDLDIAITTTCTDVDVTEFGEIALPAARLVDLLAGIDKTAIMTLTTTDTGATISVGGRSRWRLPVMPLADLPSPLVLSDDASRWTTPASEITTLFRPRAVASNEATRFYLNGCYLHSDNGGGPLISAATNGHQLMRVASIVPTGSVDIIVPAKSIATILRLDQDTERTTIFATDHRLLCVETPHTRLTTKLIDGSFPSYERMVPARASTGAIFAVAELTAALARAAAVANRDKSAPIAGLTWADGNTEIAVDLPRDGDAATDYVAGETFGAGNIAFPIGQMIHLLDALDAERVHVSTQGTGCPLRIDVPGDDAVVALQMPSRP
jgi:DNA polymerase III subunit beta